MKKFYLIISFLAFALIILFIFYQLKFFPAQKSILLTNISTNMKLTSPDFPPNTSIPSDFTCDGDNKLPTLLITGVPTSTQSLALIVDDPDSPSGNWAHWLIWNLPPDTQELSADNLPSQAVEGKNDFGNNNYGGPCPGQGEHRYQFKLYALSRQLTLPTGASKAELEAELTKYLLDQTLLVGKYQKKS